jgi:hypothetical protein
MSDSKLEVARRIRRLLPLVTSDTEGEALLDELIAQLEAGEPATSPAPQADDAWCIVIASDDDIDGVMNDETFATREEAIAAARTHHEYECPGEDVKYYVVRCSRITSAVEILPASIDCATELAEEIGGIIASLLDDQQHDYDQTLFTTSHVSFEVREDPSGLALAAVYTFVKSYAAYITMSGGEAWRMHDEREDVTTQVVPAEDEED